VSQYPDGRKGQEVDLSLRQAEACYGQIVDISKYDCSATATPTPLLLQASGLSRQQRELLFRFHALGNGLELEAVRKGDNRANNGFASLCFPKHADKTLIDLEHIDRQPLKIAEGRIPCPEIVNIDGEILVLEQAELVDGRLDVVHQLGLSQLNSELVVRTLHGFTKSVYEIRLAQLPERHIDRNTDVV